MHDSGLVYSRIEVASAGRFAPSMIGRVVDPEPPPVIRGQRLQNQQGFLGVLAIPERIRIE